MENGTRPNDHPASNIFDEPGLSQADIDRLTGAHQHLSCEDLDHEDRLERILNNPNIDEWCTPESLDTLAYFRPISQQWALIKARYKKLGGFPPDLERAVDAQLQIERASASAPPAPPRFQTISARELYAKELPPQQWIIPDILPVGETLFIGRGKDGKSLLVWNLCLAVATGGKALSAYDVEEGDVLYLALEDGERRAQQRLTEQMAHAGTDAPPERLELVLWDAPRIGEGFEEQLTFWLDDHPQARLVVIDILEKVRPRRTRNGSVYADDYAALAPLQRIAQDRNIAILIVHHSNKTRPEDFRDTASGSMGLIGACDTFWSLQRIAGEADAALRIIGRDVETQELALRFAEGFWTVLGDAEAYRLSKTSKAVLEALQDAGKPLTPKQLAKALKRSEASMRQHLKRMHERGEILNLGDGRYIPRPTPPPSPSSPPPPLGGGREGSKEGSGMLESVTPVTPVTGVTPVTHVTQGGESDTRVTGSDRGCHSGVTLLNGGKDRGLGQNSDRVTGVTLHVEQPSTLPVHITPPPPPAPLALEDYECPECGGDVQAIPGRAGYFCCLKCEKTLSAPMGAG